MTHAPGPALRRAKAEGRVSGAASDQGGAGQPEGLLHQALARVRESVMVIHAGADSGDPFIVYANAACSRMTGYRETELIGRALGTLDGPETDDEVLERRRRSFEIGEPFAAEMVNYRKDGTPFVMRWNVSPVASPPADGGGPVTHFLAIQRDVTEELRADEQRRALKAAIDQSSDAVLIFDRHGRASYVNPAYETWSGWNRERVAATAVWHIPGCPQRHEDLHWARQRLSAGMPWQREYPARLPGRPSRPDSDRRFVFVTVSPIQTLSGETVDFVAIGRDVTERRRLESVAEAHNFHDNLGYIFSGIRHELGNPVNSVKLALRYVTDSLETMPLPKIRDYLERMAEEIERVEYLLRSLRTYNLYQEPRLETVPVRRFLESFVDLARQELEDGGIELGLDVAPGVDFIHADPQALHQVLLNLVANAAEAMAGHRQPKIELGAMRVGKRTRLVVRDTGPGIPPDRIPHLFKPFFTTRHGGTGLGLPISRRLVSLMQGTLELASSAQGTRALVTLDRLPPQGQGGTIR